MNIFREKGLACILLTSVYNRVWLTDYPSTYGFIFYQPTKITYFLDSRYYAEAVEKFKKIEKIEIILLKNVEKQLTDFFNSLNLKRLGFEDAYTTIAEHEMYKKWFPNAELVPVGGPNLRKVKIDYEVQRVTRAVDISLKALHNIRNLIKAGTTEKEIANNLEYQMKKLGASKESFDTIVASGHRGAIPHGIASNKVLEEGEWITIDFGALYKNYCADITRTFKIGGNYKNPIIESKMQEIYDVVKEAQRRGISAVRPGADCAEIDAVCRSYIKSRGYEEYFQHGTGHGLGAEIHEEPYISPKSTFGPLEENNIITIEPGIYVPGVGGVRIEDDILVTKDGHKKLGNFHHLFEEDF